jgi:hypothetical protein
MRASRLKASAGELPGTHRLRPSADGSGLWRVELSQVKSSQVNVTKLQRPSGNRLKIIEIKISETLIRKIASVRGFQPYE